MMTVLMMTVDFRMQMMMMIILLVFEDHYHRGEYEYDDGCYDCMLIYIAGVYIDDCIKDCYEGNMLMIKLMTPSLESSLSQGPASSPLSATSSTCNYSQVISSKTVTLLRFLRNLATSILSPT